MRFGVTEENKAQINLDPYGNVSVFNININNVSTMDMDNASTTFHNTLNVENVSVGGSLSVTGSIEGYQETLIAGTNITITGNTISSAGSGGTLPANANFSSVNTSTLNTSTIDTSGDVSIGGQLDCDLDAFHYSAGNGRIDRGTNADVSWTSKRRGSDIQNGDSFRPKYTGKYSITLAIFFGSSSSGQVRVGLKLNGSEYNLNGGGGTYIVSADSANSDVNMFTGNMIVDAVAGQDIKAFVKAGTLRYYGAHSYFAGYYIGNT